MCRVSNLDDQSRDAQVANTVTTVPPDPPVSNDHHVVREGIRRGL